MKTRRDFLIRSAAVAGAVLIEPVRSWSQLNTNYPTFDFHSHPGLFVAKGTPIYKGDAGVLKTINEMNDGGLNGAFFSLVADGPIVKVGANGVTPFGDYKPGEAWKEYKRQLMILKGIIENMPMTYATKADDLKIAQQSRKVAAFIAIEGGDFLEGKVDGLDEMYADGVRSIQLVHYHPNAIGNLQTADPQHDGLSAAGKEIVKKMNKLKMVIDVAHAAESTVKGVVDITDSPIILSHSVLQVDISRALSKRAITAEHAKLVAKTGGIIGAWPSGYNKDFNDFIDNVKRLADLVGVDHVGLGTDMDGNFKPVMTDYLQMKQWTDALKAKGFTADEVGKIAGGNAVRLLKKVL
ncbi:MAG: membrane dipeptidase [Chryseolinea sp.]